MKYLIIALSLLLYGCVSIPPQLIKPPRYTQCDERAEFECDLGFMTSETEFQIPTKAYVYVTRCFDQKKKEFVYLPEVNKAYVCSNYQIHYRIGGFHD